MFRMRTPAPALSYFSKASWTFLFSSIGLHHSLTVSKDACTVYKALRRKMRGPAKLTVLANCECLLHVFKVSNPRCGLQGVSTVSSLPNTESVELLCSVCYYSRGSSISFGCSTVLLTPVCFASLTSYALFRAAAF